MEGMRKLALAALLAFAAPAAAQFIPAPPVTTPLPVGASTSANQTNGTQKTQVVNGSGTVLGTSAAPVRTDPTGTTPQPVTGPVTNTELRAAPVSVSMSATVGAANSEQCVTSNAGGTTVSVPAGTRTFELQNLGPNPAFCTLDGQAPVANTLGHRLAGLTSGVDKVADAWVVDINAAVLTLKCIAATAAQTTGGCLQFTVVK